MQTENQPTPHETKASLEGELSGLQAQMNQLRNREKELTTTIDAMTLQIEREKPADTDRAAIEQYWAAQARTRQEAIQRREELLAAGIAVDELAGSARSPIDEALARQGRRSIPRCFSLPNAPETTPSDAPPSPPKNSLLLHENPWTKKCWNLTQQMQIMRADPAKAQRMAEAAGVDVNAFRPVL